MRKKKKKEKRKEKSKSFMLNWRKKITKTQRYFFKVALFCLAAFLIVFGFIKKNEKVIMPAVNEIKPTEEIVMASTTTNIISGLDVPANGFANKFAAIMIDNAPEARPQAGLNDALMVWEAPVEGGRTRFMAVFNLSTSTLRVGPVRSARPFFLDWAKEVNAVYFHVGGSPEALARIKAEKIFNVNEFYRGAYFWRDSVRLAPHNVFISLKNVVVARDTEKNKFKGKEIESWFFKKDVENPAGENGREKEINFGETLVKWVYNRTENNYKRWIDLVSHKDDRGKQIAAKNVILQYVKTQTLDDVGRLKIENIGRGKALILKDGKEIIGGWEKKESASRTRFFGPDTKEIIFNQGVTWIEVVPN